MKRWRERVVPGARIELATPAFSGRSKPLAHAESAGYLCGCRQPLALSGRAGSVLFNALFNDFPATDSLSVRPSTRARKARDSLQRIQGLRLRFVKWNARTNPVFGRHPSPAKQSLVNLGFFAAESGVFYLTERNHHAWVRWAGRAFISNAIINHVHAATRYSPLSRRCSLPARRPTPSPRGKCLTWG